MLLDNTNLTHLFTLNLHRFRHIIKQVPRSRSSTEVGAPGEAPL
jgi:hypothetical protein